MAKVVMILSQQDLTESGPQNFTQVGGIYGSERIKPEEFLTEYSTESEVERADGEREPRFFRVE